MVLYVGALWRKIAAHGAAAAVGGAVPKPVGDVISLHARPGTEAVRPALETENRRQAEGQKKTVV